MPVPPGRVIARMPRSVLQVDLSPLRRKASGKVREIYEAGDELVLVSTDRVSAFDVVMNQGVPGRGVVLTQLSEFWFSLLDFPNHLITTDLDAMPEPMSALTGDARADLDGRTMYARKLDIIPVECVVRGYLAGSGWKDYQKDRTVSGVSLPAGLTNSARLPEPIFTPSTKAATGHDEPMTFEETEALIGKDRAAQLREVSLRLYQAGADHARARGIILADTKFEFGLLDGELVLADEALTPDSSRYWDAETYEPGRDQDSFDKQILRNWLETQPWNKQPPPPTVPQEILDKIAARYREIMARLMANA